MSGETAQADDLNQAIFDEPVPQLPNASVNSVKLMRGIRQEVDGDVLWHDTAEVRELNGEDEEFLATLETKENITYTEYTSAVLSRAVVNIGTLPPSAEVFGKLILADRELLFLGIIRATYGNTRELLTTCHACGTQNTVEIDLVNDFPVTEPDFDVHGTLEVKGTKGVVYQLRLPNGEDTIETQKASKTDAELNTVMLSRCAVFEEDDEPEDRLEWARKLTIADRRKLVNRLLSAQFGPKMEEVDTQCAECGVDMPILLDWVSLLLS